MIDLWRMDKKWNILFYLISIRWWMNDHNLASKDDEVSVCLCLRKNTRGIGMFIVSIILVMHTCLIISCLEILYFSRKFILIQLLQFLPPCVSSGLVIIVFQTMEWSRLLDCWLLTGGAQTNWNDLQFIFLLLTNCANKILKQNLNPHFSY